jgi:hypothetical protein
LTDPRHAKWKRYSLAFLTGRWEWQADLAADTFDQAKAISLKSPEDLVREENQNWLASRFSRTA